MPSSERREIVGPDLTARLEEDTKGLLGDPFFGVGVGQFAAFVGNMELLTVQRAEPLTLLAGIEPSLRDYDKKLRIEFHSRGERSSITITPDHNDNLKYPHGTPSERVSFQNIHGSEKLVPVVTDAYTVESPDLRYRSYVTASSEPVFPNGEITNGSHRILSAEQLQQFCGRLFNLHLQAKHRNL